MFTFLLPYLKFYLSGWFYIMLSWVSLLPCFYCSWFYACFETTWVLFHSLPWLRQIIPNHLHLWSSALINRRGGQPVGGVGLGGTPRYISMLSVGGKCQGLCRFGVRCLCPDICTPCLHVWLSTLHNGDGCCLFVFFFFFCHSKPLAKQCAHTRSFCITLFCFLQYMLTVNLTC